MDKCIYMTFVCLQVCMYVFVYVYMYVCMWACMYSMSKRGKFESFWMYMSVCMCGMHASIICMSVCAYVCMHVVHL